MTPAKGRRQNREGHMVQKVSLDHLSSKLGFDGITDFINDEGDGVWSNSEVVGQAWIIVTVGQVS
jgi:hypothetical protein